MDKMTTSPELTTRVTPITSMAPPPEYKVIFLNDDVTTVEFVVDLLISLFHYEISAAEELTIKIHSAGEATVAVLPYELAEQKVYETKIVAKNSGFPFNVKIEPIIN